MAKVSNHGLFGALLLVAAWAGPPPVGPCPGCVPVFYPGLNNSKCFRIPTIIKTHLGTLLAFAENRVSDCGDNGKEHLLVVRRSADLGKTWGPLIKVMEGTTPCPGCPAAISNPNPVEVNFSDGSKAVLLQYDTMNNPSLAHHGLDMQIWSYDDGLTWEKASVVSYPPQKNLGALIGPSVGLQSSSGTIYFSANENGGSHFLYWSKDFGRTWNASAQVSGLHGECSIAFLVDSADGRIIMNCRTGNQRRQLLWTADGAPGPVTKPAGLIDANCQGSIINQNGVLYFSNANTTKSRSHMTVKTSKDQGESWSAGVSVWTGPSAYSQLVSLGDESDVGLLFEAGTGSAYDTISFVKVDMAHQEASGMAQLESAVILVL